MKGKTILIASYAFLILGLAGCKHSEEVEYGDWIKRSDFEGVARSDAASFSINDKGYVFGGYDGKNRLSDLWEYNVQQDYWTQKAEFPGAGRTTATAFSLDNKGYIGTGFDGSNYLKDFWEYDPASNTWTQKADFGGSARSGAVSFGLSGKGYIGTGYDGNFLKDMWQYDPATDTWNQTTSAGGSKRNNATAFVHGDKAYLVCGINNGAYITDFWRFDPADQQWTKMRDIANKNLNEDYDDDYNIARANAVAVYVGNRIFLTCGESGSLRSDTWEYLPDADLWEPLKAFEGTSRTGTVSINTSTRGFVLTGRSSTYRFDDVWEFLPDELYDENT